jgi:hypothetical protein
MPEVMTTDRTYHQPLRRQARTERPATMRRGRDVASESGAAHQGAPRASSSLTLIRSPPGVMT